MTKFVTSAEATELSIAVAEIFTMPALGLAATRKQRVKSARDLEAFLVLYAIRCRPVSTSVPIQQLTVRRLH